MTSGRSRARELVGLVAMLSLFALTGYVIELLQGNPSLPRMLTWFAGAVVGHDLVAFPLYASTDRLAVALLNAAKVNYLRVPAAASALLFVVYLPGILRQGGGTYLSSTGQTQEPFLGRWIALVAIAFGISALVYLARHFAARRPGRKT